MPEQIMMHGPLTQAQAERAVRIDTETGHHFGERVIRIAAAAPEISPEQASRLALLLQPVPRARALRAVAWL